MTTNVPTLPPLRMGSGKNGGARSACCAFPQQEFLSYDGYSKALKRYCRDAGVPEISTHELRHSTAGIWKRFGQASHDDMKMLFATQMTVSQESTSTVGMRGLAIRMFPE